VSAGAGILGTRAASRGVRERSAPESLALRLGVFLALGAFAALHWASFVAPAASGRALLIVALATAGGAAIALAGRLRVPPPATAAVRCAALAGTLVLTFAAAGLAPRLLLPAGWDELADGLDRGFAGLATLSWPYDGDDARVRRTILLVLPPAFTAAALLAFWPVGRATPTWRALSLAILVTVYAAPVTERELGAPELRGLVLLALVAAWLWAPRLPRAEFGAAAVAVALAAVVALPFAGALDVREPWFDHQSWNWFESRSTSTRFQWDHRYGPITWPRDGKALLDVRARRPHYWKAETLNRFDGMRWVGSGSDARLRVGAELPERLNPRWDERITFTVRGLQSDLVVGAGTIYDFDGPAIAVGSSDGTARIVDSPLRRGDVYTVSAYVPDPSARELRSAPPEVPAEIARYTYFELPERPRAGTGPVSGDNYPQVRASRTVAVPRPGDPLSGTPGAERRIRESPYARTYRLARRLAAGQATTYDLVRTVERHLERSYTYNETPPAKPVPLEAFLFEDRIGYCQQFSGAMALILRMNGIAARVAAGFSPGAYDDERKEFRVRDLDAHSWVEVYYTGLGWVPFDPTPSLSPASSQSDSDRSASAASGGSDRGSSGDRATGSDRASAGAADAPGGGEGASPWLLVPVLAVLVGGGLVAHRLSRGRRRRAGGLPDAEVAELRAALERMGHDVPARTTLAQLERRLALLAGPGAARYAALLRARRYARRGAPAPSRADRRALREALASGQGPLARLRALRALPPRGGPRFTHG
jgi:transglutaminase-like putative cysteine protease